jgi:hydroxyethylthiazole kinase
MQFSDYLNNVRQKNPLVHHITNYVTVNDCANACLAIGASPVMADAIDEAESMASISSALVLNIGTLNVGKVESMMVAGRSANAGHKPVIFDPVGCGATPFRNRMAGEIMDNVSMTVVRGNMSEIASLGGRKVFTKGVDAGESSDITVVPMARELAEKWHTVVVISGPVDIITDGKKTVLIHNGCPEMSLITGSGCMCTTVIGAFCGANPDYPLESAAAAMAAMGLAGERAWSHWGKEGLGHFHMALIDELGKMTGEELDKGARYEED